MKIYLVGGAVRDQLLGLPIKEKDWVVVGATVEDMLKLGYKQVGKAFPVFLHPLTREEYALARVERKVKPGYTGFTFDASNQVTLEEDLKRRDLTINAIAQTIEGEIIDPYAGSQDIKRKVLRHVSNAFAEDPVRILRVGRFLARFAHMGFTIAPETLALMQKMVAAGEVNALVAERVFKELERALAEPSPEKFFAALAKCHAMPILFPALDQQSKGIQALEKAKELTTDPRIRFAVLFFDNKTPRETLREVDAKYKLPTAYKNLALLTALHHQQALEYRNATAEDLLDLFSKMDAFRRRERFNQFLTACLIISKLENAPFDVETLKHYADVASKVDVQVLINSGSSGAELIDRIKAKRLAAIQKAQALK